MARKRFKVKEIINKLREVEVNQSRGMSLQRKSGTFPIVSGSTNRIWHFWKCSGFHSLLGYKPPVPAALEHRSDFITDRVT